MDNRCVVVCDSGVGGLPVLKRLAKSFPSEDFVYLSDGKNMPYGDKTSAQMRVIARNVVESALSFAPKLIVVACNTLSAELAISRNSYPTEIITTKPTIGKGSGYVFCTPRAAEYSSIGELGGEKIEVVAMARLAKEIENSVLRGERPTVDEKSFELLDSDVDFVSLGCTHYAYAAKAFKTYFKRAEIIDGADRVVRLSNGFIARNAADKKSGCVGFVDDRYANVYASLDEILG